MNRDPGRTVKPKRCKLTALHVEHHWYDAPNDQFSVCDGQVFDDPGMIFDALDDYQNNRRPDYPAFPPGSEPCL